MQPRAEDLQNDLREPQKITPNPKNLNLRPIDKLHLSFSSSERTLNAKEVDGELELLRTMLQKEFKSKDFKEKNNWHKTPLRLAKEQGHATVVQFLTEKGANE